MPKLKKIELEDFVCTSIQEMFSAFNGSYSKEIEKVYVPVVKKLMKKYNLKYDAAYDLLRPSFWYLTLDNYKQKKRTPIPFNEEGDLYIKKEYRTLNNKKINILKKELIKYQGEFLLRKLAIINQVRT